MIIKLKSGFSLLEVVVGSAIITTSLLGVLYSFPRLLSLTRENVYSTKATYLLEEGVEVARIWRDETWTNLSTLALDTDYYYQWTSGSWATSTTNVYIDGLFERKFRVSAVRRSGGEIVTSGGSVDAETKLVTVTVSWLPPRSTATTTRSVSAYLTNLFE